MRHPVYGFQDFFINFITISMIKQCPFWMFRWNHYWQIAQTSAKTFWLLGVSQCTTHTFSFSRWLCAKITKPWPDKDAHEPPPLSIFPPGWTSDTSHRPTMRYSGTADNTRYILNEQWNILFSFSSKSVNFNKFQLYGNGLMMKTKWSRMIYLWQKGNTQKGKN